jgi:hypothetical protein
VLEGFRLRLGGRAGDKYLIEKPSDLLNWTEIETSLTQKGTVDLVDQNPDPLLGYYRGRIAEQ